MKIASLKRQADARAADARADRVEYKARADRSLAILRERVGSNAGIAIAFSLGFMTGTGTAGRGGKGAEYRDRHFRGDRGIAYELAHGPLGQNALKLGAALLARSLTKTMEEGLPSRAAEAYGTSPGESRGAGVLHNSAHDAVPCGRL